MEAATARATAAGNKPTPWNPHREPEQEQGREKKGSYRVTYQNAANGQVKQIRCEREREIDRERWRGEKNDMK